ncbi:hypothetical protein GE115_14325 [Agromyces sp. CFH 90414]|uniref:Uncharacterized protein n=1 Tax=Agromyces agglutinans TaxID=2662258 RepID=A0A6I2F9P3_9MICO|nr:hypothetical protein [Agromyces agglutinans]MRG61031.1 hypothetical protein [Agromyces agglutinans]
MSVKTHGSDVASPPRTGILGFVGIALAVLAVIGVSSPSILFELIGGVLLIAALAVSAVALLRPGRRWPALVAIGICVIAAVVAVVMFVAGFVAGYTGAN